MSAVAGYVALGGPAPSDALAAKMLAQMAHRIPDGRGVWGGTRAVLGQGMLHTTPESLHETLPLVRGPFTLVADARVDNREALLHELSGDLRELDLLGDVVPDAALLLAAHARWGHDAPTHLVGAFVYAVWDDRVGELVLVRDALGVRQVAFHHVPGQHFAFGTEASALFAVEGIEAEIDEHRIAESLSGRGYEPVQSLFRGIVKLKPAHRLVVTASGVRESRYWELAIPAPPAGDAAEQFAEVFEEAVRCRTRSAFPVGAELSGGMDSSSVAVVAAESLRERGETLHTLSATFDQAAGSDERVYIQAVLDRLGDAATPHTFQPEGERFVTLHEEIFQRVADGRVNGNHHFNYLSMRAARDAGIRIVLTGQDGDTTVGHGWEWFAEQALAGEWDAMRREADRCIARLAPERDAYEGQIDYTSPSQILSAYGVPVFRQWAEEKRVLALLQGARGARRAFGASYRLLGRALGRDLLRTPAGFRTQRRTRAEAFARSSLPPTLRSDVAARTRLAERLRDREERRLEEATRPGRTAEAQRKMLTSEYLEGAFERLDLYAAACGVEARHPFMDVRLIELCLSLPTDEKLRDGYSRSVMRRALADRLPPSITWRANKADLGRPQDGFVFDSEPERTRALIQDPGLAAQYVDTAGVQALWDRRETLSEWEMGWLSNALALIVWMRTSPYLSANRAAST